MCSAAWAWTTCGGLRLNSSGTGQSGKKVTLRSHSLESCGGNTVYKETDIFITRDTRQSSHLWKPLVLYPQRRKVRKVAHFSNFRHGYSWSYQLHSHFSPCQLWGPSLYIQVSHADVKKKKNLCAFFQVNILLFNWIFAHLGCIRELRGHFLQARLYSQQHKAIFKAWRLKSYLTEGPLITNILLCQVLNWETYSFINEH